MNLKLSTSAALTLSLNAGADDKTALADKIAASYYVKHFDRQDGYPRKSIFRHAGSLRGSVRKDAVGSAASLGGRVSATNIISKRPDVGILGARGLRPDQSNLHSKKRVKGSLTTNVIKSENVKMRSESPDIGILGRSKSRRHRSSVTTKEPQLPRNHYSDDDSYFIDYWETGAYLCEVTDYSGAGPRRRSQEWIRQSVNNSSGTPLDDLPLPTCRCQDDQLTTCGPDLCNCLQNSKGDITYCMDEINMLCEGTAVSNSTSASTNNGTDDFIAQTLTIEQCAGNEWSSASYCSMLPCILGGGSYEQCTCDTIDHICNTTSNDFYCTISTCCQGQADDAGRLSCLYDTITYGPYTSYGSNETSLSFVTDYLECRETKSIPECKCNMLSSYCEQYPQYCNIQHQTCCQSEEDAGKVECIADTFYESCINDGYSKYHCLCEKSSIACEIFSMQCEVHECCSYSVYSVESFDDDVDEQMKACVELGRDENHPSPAVTVAPTEPVPLINPIQTTNHPHNSADIGINTKASKTGSKTSEP